MATLSTLCLLNILTVTSHQVNLLRTVNKQLHDAVSQFYMKSQSNETLTVTPQGTRNMTVKVNFTSKHQTAGIIQSIPTKETRDQQTLKTSQRIKGRPLNCTACFPHNYTYVLDNENICQPTDRSPSVDIIVLISTIHSNVERRKALRETWLTPTSRNQGSIRYVFLLGMTSNVNLQVAVETESATYRDIVQEDFIDHYNNLTLKTMMGFKWASIKCKGAKYVLKTDDDMYVNLPALKLTLKKYDSVLKTSIGGQCRINESPIRQKGYKWYVPREMYPPSQFPGYCSGTGYVTSMDVVQKVYEVSKHVPFFYLEDVYVGICVHRLGMKVTRIQGFNAGRVPLGCNYKNSYVITSHQLDPKLLRAAWALKCNDALHL